MTGAPERVAEPHVALPTAPWARLWRSGPALLSLTMLFWAGSVIVGRAAAPVLPPVLFTLLRWSGALVIVAPLAWPYLRADLPKLWARKWTTLLLAVLGVCAYNVLVYRGLTPPRPSTRCCCNR
ncbi:MAG: EamA family transporter [Janthinobacterium lividum]